MLKVVKKREITGEFWVTDELATDPNKKEILVKTVTISLNHEAVATVYESMNDPEAYAKYRKEMRQQEKELRNLRYKIEDEILAEIEESETKE